MANNRRASCALRRQTSEERNVKCYMYISNCAHGLHFNCIFDADYLSIAKFSSLLLWHEAIKHVWRTLSSLKSDQCFSELNHRRYMFGCLLGCSQEFRLFLHSLWSCNESRTSAHAPSDSIQRNSDRFPWKSKLFQIAASFLPTSAEIAAPGKCLSSTAGPLGLLFIKFPFQLFGESRLGRLLCQLRVLNKLAASPTICEIISFG